MAQTVADVMSKKVVRTAANDPVAAAARQMRDNDIGTVVVEDHGRMVGILTDRDIVIRVVADQNDPESVPARQVCSGNLRTVGTATPVTQAVEIMRAQAIRRLPVVDAQDNTVGIVSIGDLAIERDDGSALAYISAAKPNK